VNDHSFLSPISLDHHSLSSGELFPNTNLLEQLDTIICLCFLSLPSNCDRFCTDTMVDTLYFLYNVNNGSVELPTKSANSSIYKK